MKQYIRLQRDPSFGAALGMQAASGATGGIMGLALQGLNDKRQLKQQKKLQALEIAGQQQMTDYNTQKQLEMWEKTGYSAQMKQLREAGLNPGLIYGMGGAGGQTANIEPGKVSGAEAPKGGGEAQGLMGMGMQMGLQLQLLKAQKENIEADTNLKNTDAQKKGGVDTKEAEARILNLQALTDNEKARGEMLKIETSILSIKEHIAGMTQNTAIAAAQKELQIATEQLERMERENEIGSKTKDDAVKRIRAEATGAVLENELKRQNINLTKEQIIEVQHRVDNIVNEIYNRNRHYNQLSTHEMIALWEANDNGTIPKEISNIAGGILGGVLGGGMLKKTIPPISGLHDRRNR